MSSRELPESVKHLIQAKAHLQQQGWCKGIWHDGFTGKTCAAGAILFVTNNLIDVGFFKTIGHGTWDNSIEWLKAHTALALAINPEAKFNTFSDAQMIIAAWNNAYHRTFDEVIAMFDKAIANEMKKAGMELLAA